MKYLSINKKPYTLDFALFERESKELMEWGTVYFHEKDEDKRIVKIWDEIEKLLEKYEPNIVITQMIDLRHTLKRDLEHIYQIRTIFRKLCYDKNIMYNEFKTSGWEKRITNLKYPSPKAKLGIAKEYTKAIHRVEVADAIILGEGVIWGRLQIGRD
jgi:hypothetical protein